MKQTTTTCRRRKHRKSRTVGVPKKTVIEHTQTSEPRMKVSKVKEDAERTIKIDARDLSTKVCCKVAVSIFFFLVSGFKGPAEMEWEKQTGRQTQKQTNKQTNAKHKTITNQRLKLDWKPRRELCAAVLLKDCLMICFVGLFDDRDYKP